MRSPATPHLAIALALLVGACSGPADSPTPTATAAPAPSVVSTAAPSLFPTASALPSAPSTAQPTAAPSPASAAIEFPTEVGFVNQFVMKVAVSDLNVRAKPTTKSGSIGKAPKGGLFMVADWPITADGHTWYFGFLLPTTTPGTLPALPDPIGLDFEDTLSGWMATGTADSPFLVPVGPRCPTTVDLANVSAMLASEQIDCFGSDTISLQGTFGCDGCDGETPGTFEPAWLADYLRIDRLQGVENGPLVALAFPPAGPSKPTVGLTIQVTGHFSDSRSSTCSITVFDEALRADVKIAAAAAKQWCQGRFVVESYTVVG